MESLMPSRLSRTTQPARGLGGSPGKTLAARAACMLTSLLAATSVHAERPHVEQAIQMLRGACVLKGAHLEMGRPGDGRLHMRVSEGGRVRGVTNLVHEDVELFNDMTMEALTRQSLDLSACMQPGVDQIVAALLELPREIRNLPLAAPAAATPAPSTVYIPPPLPAQAPPPPPPTVVAAQGAPAAAAPAPSVVAGGDGPLRLVFTTLEVNPESNSDWRGDLIGRMGVELTNTTPNALRVVLVDPWPVVQVDGGQQFNFKGINGLANSYQAKESNCMRFRQGFTPLRPGQTVVINLAFELSLRGSDAPKANGGRLSGQLLVLDEVTQKCWTEPLSASRLNVRLNR
jgi:hypothetical protein